MKKQNMALAAIKSTFQNFDPRSLQKLTNPQAAEDLNVFLEKLPQHAGQTMLIVAGVVWAAAGAVGLFTTVQLQALTELRVELQEAQALNPIVPTIKKKPVDAASMRRFVEGMTEVYKGLNLKVAGSGLTMNARSTNAYGQFREAIGHIQNGGAGWKIDIDELCVGRECEGGALMAALKINTISVSRVE